MSGRRFETVVIELRGGHYRVVRGDEVLLAVPRDVFEAYDADAVFPPAWQPRDTGGHPVRRLYWNPGTREFLMAGLQAHPARVAEGWGSTPYRSFLQAFWLPRPPVLFVRPFWQPGDPTAPFDEAARQTSFHVQERFVDLLGRLRPPPGWTAVLNATTPYLEAVGVSLDARPVGPDAVHELSLAPVPGPRDPHARAALEAVATGHPGRLFPVVRAGRLVAVHALDLPARHQGEAVLREHGLGYQEGPYLPH